MCGVNVGVVVWGDLAVGPIQWAQAAPHRRQALGPGVVPHLPASAHCHAISLATGPIRGASQPQEEVTAHSGPQQGVIHMRRRVAHAVFGVWVVC